MKLGFKLLLCVIASIILLGSFAHAEIYLWNNVILNPNNLNESIVRYHAYYWFDDTSASGVGKNKAVPIELYAVIQALPYNLTSGQVDWCNFSIKHFANQYDNDGNLINSTMDIQSYYYSGTPLNTTDVFIDLKSRDELIADIDCHYTDSLYDENILVGRFTTFLPSFECKGCSDYTLEELSNEVERADEITANELEIYDGIQTIVDWNYTLWLIASWIVKIGLVFVGIGLIFAGVYYFYVFLKNLSQEI